MGRISVDGQLFEIAGDQPTDAEKAGINHVLDSMKPASNEPSLAADVGSGINEGLLLWPHGLLDLTISNTNKGANKLLNQYGINLEGPPDQYYSDAGMVTGNKLGLTNAPGSPETPGVRAGKMISMAVPGTGLVGAMSKVEWAIPWLKRMAETTGAVNSFRTAPEMYTLKEAAAAMGAAGGGYFTTSVPEVKDAINGMYQDYQKQMNTLLANVGVERKANTADVSEITGQIVGGILSPAGVELWHHVSLTSNFLKIINRIRKSFTPTGARARAASVIQKNVPDTNAIAKDIEAAKTIPNAKLTPGALSGNEPLMSMEKAVIARNPQLAKTIQEDIAATNSEIENQIQQFGGKDAVSLFFDGEHRRLKRAMDARMATAMGEMDQAVRKLKPNASRLETSDAMSGALESAVRDARVQESQLWNDLPPDQELVLDNAKRVYRDVVTEETPVPGFVKKVLGDSGEETTTLSENAPARTMESLHITPRPITDIFKPDHSGGYDGLGLRGYGRPSLEVLKNPTQSEVNRYALRHRDEITNKPITELRYMMDGNGDMYVWDAGAAIHRQVEPRIPGLNPNYVTEGSDVIIHPSQYGEELRFAKNLLAERGGQAEVPLEGKVFSFKDVREFRSKILRAQRGLRANNNAEGAWVLQQLNEAILNDIQNTNLGPDFKNAVLFSRRLNDTFTRGPVGKLLKFAPEGGRKIAPELLSEEVLTKSGPVSAANVRAVRAATEFPGGAATPQLDGAMAEHIRNQVFNTEGEFNLSAAKTLLEKKGELLNEFPALRQDISDAVKSKGAIDKLRANLDTADKALTGITARRKTALAMVLNAKPDSAEIGSNVMRDLLNARDPNMLRQAISNTRNVSYAHRGLQDAYMQEMWRTGLTNQRDALNNQIVGGTAMRDFLNRTRKRVLNPGKGTAPLFTSKEWKGIETIVSTAERMEKFMNTSPMNYELLQSRLGFLEDTVVRLLGLRLGSQVGKETGIPYLMLAGQFSKLGQNIAFSMPQARMLNAIGEAIRDPELMKDLLTRPSMAKGRHIPIKRLNAWMMALDPTPLQTMVLQSNNKTGTGQSNLQ